MIHIRPWQFFEKFTGNVDVIYRIPSHRGVVSETIMSMETMLLVVAARMIGARTILELGTSLGYNALQLARNTGALIETVDNMRRPWVFKGEECESQIATFTTDLKDVVVQGHNDMVFCDINYTLDTITRSTDIAFACSPKVVAWHDYGHPLNPHVKPFLDKLSYTKELIHIEDSWIVFWFNDELQIW